MTCWQIRLVDDDSEFYVKSEGNLYSTREKAISALCEDLWKSKTFQERNEEEWKLEDLDINPLCGNGYLTIDDLYAEANNEKKFIEDPYFGLRGYYIKELTIL